MEGRYQLLRAMQAISFFSPIIHFFHKHQVEILHKSLLLPRIYQIWINWTWTGFKGALLASIETSLKLTPGVVPAGVWCWDKVELDYDSIMISITSASMFPFRKYTYPNEVINQDRKLL